MEELMIKLLEKVRNDKRGLRMLKEVAVRVQQYDLASEIRTIEVEKFPESEYEKELKKKAKEIVTLVSMVGYKIDDEFGMMLFLLFDIYRKKKGGVDIKNAQSIQREVKEIYK